MHYICDYHGVIAGTPGIDLLREPFADGDIGFTNPKRVDWWEQQLREILIDYSFDGWMEDCGEWVADTDRFMPRTRHREVSASGASEPPHPLVQLARQRHRSISGLQVHQATA